MIRYRSNITNESFSKVHVLFKAQTYENCRALLCKVKERYNEKRKPAQLLSFMCHHRFLLLLKILHTCAVIHVSFSSLDTACVADKAQREHMFVRDRCTCGNEKKSLFVFVVSMHRV